MNREQVMALTDEELRIRAAELAGWKPVAEIPSAFIAGWRGPTMNPKVDVPAWLKIDAPREGFPAGGELVTFDHLPNYPHDIAAAWELGWMVCQQREMWMRVTTPFFAGEPCWAGFCPQQVTGWNGRMDVEAPGDRPEQAITRAFVLAMSGGCDVPK